MSRRIDEDQTMTITAHASSRAPTVYLIEDDADLRDSIEAVLARRIGAVDTVLASYGVPRIDRLPGTASR